MRLQILNDGHNFGYKLLFMLIRTVSRQPVLDVVKLAKYRPDFYGIPMSEVTQEAMRGPSTWSVAERELMAAFIAKTNHCEFCTNAHSAVAELAYGNGNNVSAVLCDKTSEIEQPLQATLLLLQKLTREHTIDADDIRSVLAAGASPQQVADALTVCFCFNVMGRLADAFNFSIPTPQALRAGAKYLLARGYQ